MAEPCAGELVEFAATAKAALHERHERGHVLTVSGRVAWRRRFARYVVDSQTRDASSSVSVNVAVEKNQVFDDVVVLGGYDMGGTQSQTSVSPMVHDLNQLPSGVASPSSS